MRTPSRRSFQSSDPQLLLYLANVFYKEAHRLPEPLQAGFLGLGRFSVASSCPPAATTPEVVHPCHHQAMQMSSPVLLIPLCTWLAIIFFFSLQLPISLLYSSPSQTFLISVTESDAPLPFLPSLPGGSVTIRKRNFPRPVDDFFSWITIYAPIWATVKPPTSFAWSHFRNSSNISSMFASSTSVAEPSSLMDGALDSSLRFETSWSRRFCFPPRPFSSSSKTGGISSSFSFSAAPGLLEGFLEASAPSFLLSSFPGRWSASPLPGLSRLGGMNFASPLDAAFLQWAPAGTSPSWRHGGSPSCVSSAAFSLLWRLRLHCGVPQLHHPQFCLARQFSFPRVCEGCCLWAD